jgi:hypothetical protein
MIHFEILYVESSPVDLYRGFMPSTVDVDVQFVGKRRPWNTEVSAPQAQQLVCVRRARIRVCKLELWARRVRENGKSVCETVRYRWVAHFPVSFCHDLISPLH